MTPQATVAVVGSYGVGLWIRTPHMPAAGETVLGSGFLFGHGGKGSNQAVGAARLGVRSELLTCVGEDAFGAGAQALWEDEGVHARALVRAERPTMAGFIILDELGENRIITDPGANSLLTPEDVEDFVAGLDRGGVLLTQLEIPVAAVGAALASGRARGLTTILNPAPAQSLPPALFEHVDVLTPNQSEARILLHLAPDDPIPDEDVGHQLLRLGAKTVVLTCGAAGALVFDDGSTTSCAALTVQVEDTTGAGDGFNAALAAALAAGAPLRGAVMQAVHAGALVVTVAGVIPALPTRAHLDASLSHHRST